MIKLCDFCCEISSLLKYAIWSNDLVASVLLIIPNWVILEVNIKENVCKINTWVCVLPSRNIEQSNVNSWFLNNSNSKCWGYLNCNIAQPILQLSSLSFLLTKVTVLAQSSFIFLLGSIHYTDVYRHESDRCHTIPNVEIKGKPGKV